MADNRCGTQLTPQELRGATTSRRNCNPGNIRDAQGNFLTFATYEAGFAYLMDYVKRVATGQHKKYPKGGSTNILEFFETYSPREDFNYPEKYAAYVAKRIGKTIDTRLSDFV